MHFQPGEGPSNGLSLWLWKTMDRLHHYPGHPPTAAGHLCCPATLPTDRWEVGKSGWEKFPADSLPTKHQTRVPWSGYISDVPKSVVSLDIYYLAPDS